MHHTSQTPGEGAPSSRRGATNGDDRPAGGAGADAAAIEGLIIGALKTCYDPEIPVDIYELGLIYGIDADEQGKVGIRMTLTSPMCPVAGTLPVEVEQKVRAVPGVAEVKVEVVWEPPWTPEKMSDAAKLQLNMF
jgi:FeS assembly SUF system protein